MNTLIVVTVLTTLFASSLAQSKCVSTSNCRCQLDANSVIDLNKITERLITSRLLEKFTFQLCQKFNIKNNCTGVFGCEEILGVYHSLGNSSQFVDPSTVLYKSNDRSAVVKLKCDRNHTDSLAYTDTKNGTYSFVLTSKYACVEALTTPAPNTTATSTTTTTKSTSTTTKTTTKTTPTTKSTTTKATTKTSTTTPKSTSTTPKSTSTNTTPKSSSTTPKVSSTTVTTKKGAASTVSKITFGSILLAVILSWTLQ